MIDRKLGHDLGAFHVLTHLILTVSLWGGICYSLHFMNENIFLIDIT